MLQSFAVDLEFIDLEQISHNLFGESFAVGSVLFVRLAFSSASTRLAAKPTQYRLNEASETPLAAAHFDKQADNREASQKFLFVAPAFQGCFPFQSVFLRRWQIKERHLHMKLGDTIFTHCLGPGQTPQTLALQGPERPCSDRSFRSSGKVSLAGDNLLNKLKQCPLCPQLLETKGQHQ